MGRFPVGVVGPRIDLTYATQHLGAGLVDPDRVERLLDEIEVQRPELPAEVT